MLQYTPSAGGSDAWQWIIRAGAVAGAIAALVAGKKYIDAGGNGDVKHYYENLVREHTK